MPVTPSSSLHQRLQGCPCCGLVQEVSSSGEGRQMMRPVCCRCGTQLRYPQAGGDNQVAAAWAVTGIILYIPAVTLPIMRVQHLGFEHHSSILSGTWSLALHGEWIVAIVVGLCSIVIPLGKLLLLAYLALNPPWRDHLKAKSFHVVDQLGRWGMVDVLLVAVVVASLKLGSIIAVSPGPAALIFTLMVIVSIIAACMFDTTRLWYDRPAVTPSSGEHV
ncbi:MAG: paraquat-inducible protein A [Planctomycetota bacterium]|nr:MAG: paraquat-inducible protein A [Planctomycetota bacterium]